jgi:hypothetical protein
MPNMPESMHNSKVVKIVSILLLFLVFICFRTGAQQSSSMTGIADMKWQLDYELLLRLANDSTYTYDIRELFHVADEKIQSTSEFILYPVALSEDYINGITSVSSVESSGPELYKTLWNALHSSINGGWVHFNNCLLYAFETGYLNLASPFMRRPVTKWKPRPVTETYIRTRNWKYYVPVDQKAARKEFEIRRKDNELGDITSIPRSIIEFFLSTSDRELQHMQQKGETKKIAQINLVKLMLGINYLGEPQILYIRSSVLNAIKNYSAAKLPTIIIFDRFNAAAVMNLDSEGYKIEAIAFRNAEALTAEDGEKKKQEIQKIIDDINEYNRNQFTKRLDGYYKP